MGFRLTADQHFHLENKKLTNLAPPVDNNDAVTKKHLTDALKAKAGTNYVNKELAKKKLIRVILRQKPRVTSLFG